jgi:hypothetical protein
MPFQAVYSEEPADRIHAGPSGSKLEGTASHGCRVTKPRLLWNLLGRTVLQLRDRRFYLAFAWDN